MAPVSIGPRELADVLLPPFEMALRAGARSVMNSYTDLDGVPVAADASLLTGLLRGTVRLHRDGGLRLLLGGIPAHPARGGRDPCRGRRPGAARGHRRGTAHRGLLRRPAAGRPGGRGRRPRPGGPGRRAGSCRKSASWACSTRTGTPSRSSPPRTARASMARSPARWRGSWPAAPSSCCATKARCRLSAGQRLAVVGPRAHHASAMLGCYSFPQHVGVHHPELPIGIEVPTVLDALRGDPAGYAVSYAEGCPVLGGDDAGLAEAARAARGGRRVRCRARRPGRPVRPGHLRERAPTRPACGCPAARRNCSKPCWPRERRWCSCCCRAAVRAGPAGGPAGRRGLRVLPRRGRRGCAGRRAERPGQPIRAAAGQLPGTRFRPARDLPGRTARPAQRRQHHRSDPAVPVRAWAFLRPGHLGQRPLLLPGAMADRRPLPAAGHAPQRHVHPDG